MATGLHIARRNGWLAEPLAFRSVGRYEYLAVWADLVVVGAVAGVPTPMHLPRSGSRAPHQ